MTWPVLVRGAFAWSFHLSLLGQAGWDYIQGIGAVAVSISCQGACVELIVYSLQYFSCQLPGSLWSLRFFQVSLRRAAYKKGGVYEDYKK